MNTASSETRERGSNWAAGVAVTALWLITVLGSRYFLELGQQLPTWGRVTAALVPVVPTALFLWVVISNLRSLDEMHRMVHLTALAIAYPLAILLLVTLGFLQLAIDLPAEDWSYRHIWIYLPLFYFLGLGISWRRYR